MEARIVRLRLILTCLALAALTHVSSARAQVQQQFDCGPVVSSCQTTGTPIALVSAYVTPGATTPLFLMVFNSTTVPSNGAVTIGSATGNVRDCVGPFSSSQGINYGPLAARPYSAGVVVVASSAASCATLALSPTATIHVTVQQ